MVHPSFYTLMGEGPVPAHWFTAQRTRYSTKSDVLRDTYLSAEIAILKDFHDGVISTEQAAYAITRPITNNPVPSLGTFSDGIVALTQLWRLYKDALVEWPPSRSQELVKLGIAISELPDQLHKGQALDDSEDDEVRQPLAWKGLPYLYMVWRDAHWQRPYDLVQDCRNDEAWIHARDVYLKQQDIEARLVAASILQYKLAFQAVITSLEVARSTLESDDHDPGKDGDFEPLVPDFHIPSAARWIAYNGKRMYTSVVENGLSDIEGRGIPLGARGFDKPADRWSYWEDKLRDMTRDGSDEFTKGEASAALGKMKKIRDSS